MKETDTYVLAALLDVIGFRRHLKQDRESGRLDFKDALQKAMNVLSNVNEADYAYQAISDTIIITSVNVADLAGLLSVLKDVQLSFLREGLLIRGGVAHERHFKSKTITYSHALVLAHQIEIDVAVYPRVVVDDNVIEMQRGNNEVWHQLSKCIDTKIDPALDGLLGHGLEPNHPLRPKSRSHWINL